MLFSQEKKLRKEVEIKGKLQELEKSLDVLNTFDD